MRRPQIKPAHNPAWTPSGQIRIGSMQFGIGSEIETNDNEAVWTLFELMDGSRTSAQILAEFASARPDIPREDALSNIARFDIQNLQRGELPHLNLEIQIDGIRQASFDPHTPIDISTVRPGDIP